VKRRRPASASLKVRMTYFVKALASAERQSASILNRTVTPTVKAVAIRKIIATRTCDGKILLNVIRTPFSHQKELKVAFPR
jgi:hypothetical protein